MDDLLDSLALQSYPAHSFEVIIADNGSSDDTIKRAQAHNNIQVLALPENLGFAKGNNAAAAKASGEIFAFLNQDTVCHPHWLEGLIDQLLSNDDIGAVESNMLLPHDPGFLDNSEALPKDLRVVDITPFGYGARRIFPEVDSAEPRIISGCSFVIRRDTAKRLGEVFDPDFWMYAEDTDMSLRLRNMGLRLVAARRSVVHHLHGEMGTPGKGSLSKMRKAVANRVFAFYKNMTGPEFALYFPLLLIGNWTKIFALSMSWKRKALYALPFGLFSTACMLWALTRCHAFTAKRHTILSNRAGNRKGQFAIMKHIFRNEKKSGAA